MVEIQDGLGGPLWGGVKGINDEKERVLSKRGGEVVEEEKIVGFISINHSPAGNLKVDHFLVGAGSTQGRTWTFVVDQG